MNEYDLTVRRSALLMWIVAVAGVPFIIFGVDILLERRLATTITDLIYPSENVTPPPFETHDLAWAWVLLVAGSALTVWALKELIAPRRVVHADHRGVALAVGGPFTASPRLPWSALDDVMATMTDDEAGEQEVLRLLVAEPERLPGNPWGARWVGEGVLDISANEWDVAPAEVAERLVQMAETYRDVAELETVDAPAATWLDDDTEEVEEPSERVDGPWVRDDAEMADDLAERVTASEMDTDAAPESDSDE